MTKNMLDRLRRRFKCPSGYEVSVFEFDEKEWIRRGRPRVWRQIVYYEKIKLVEDITTKEIILFDDDKIVGISFNIIFYKQYVGVSNTFNNCGTRLYKSV